MKTSLRNNIFISATLLLLVLSAGYIRFNNFYNCNYRTIDGAVYYMIGSQLTDDILDYNAQAYGKNLKKRTGKAPEYMMRPLFKHPPFFCYSVAACIKIFGDRLLSAFYPSLFFGVMMIPLVYFLGKLVFDWRVGLLAAVLLWMDPVSTMTSQKIWMESTLAFFTLLAVYLFLKGSMEEKNHLLVLSGFAAGLAALTKYPGLLTTIGIVLYTVMCERKLLKNKYFILSMLMPLIMLLPWLYWNSLVYGSNWLVIHSKLHTRLMTILGSKILVSGFAAFFLFIIVAVIRGLLEKQNSFIEKKNGYPERKISATRKIFLVCTGVLFVIAFRENIYRSFLITYIPETTWFSGFYRQEPLTFYLGRLMEYSMFYILGIFSLVLPVKGRFGGIVLSRIMVVVVILFYSLWGNFQCRYIQAGVPFLILLSSGLYIWIFEYVREKTTSKNIQWFAFLILASFFVVNVLKIFFINTFLSFPNNMGYF